MVRKGITITTVSVVLVAAVVLAVVFVTHLTGPQLPYCSVNATGSTSTSGSSDAANPTHYSFSAEQAGNAATIAAVGTRLGLPAHAVTIALATAWQESKLINLTSGDRDSAGLFQQRPSQGWGTYDQVTDPVHAATAFYQHLMTKSDWQNLSVTQAAQEVQHSATPDAYAQWEAESRAMASALTGQTQAQLSCHNLSVAPSNQDVDTVAAQEWGSGNVAGAHDVADGWAVGSWLVAKATALGIDSVTVGDQTWTAESGDWSTGGTGAGTGAVTLHKVQVAPTS